MSFEDFERAMKRAAALRRHNELMKKRKQHSTFFQRNTKAAPLTRQALAARLSAWTRTGSWRVGYKDIQALKRRTRHVTRSVSKGVRSMPVRSAQTRPMHTQTVDSNASIARYFRAHARRAPGRPARQRHVTVLYRGTDLTAAQLKSLLGKGFHDELGYSSFSTVKNVAMGFRRAGGVFRLRLSDIERGTPYIWFTDPHDKRGGNAVTEHPGESEVLLPPGRFSLAARGSLAGATIPVKFVPS